MTIKVLEHFQSERTAGGRICFLVLLFAAFSLHLQAEMLSYDAKIGDRTYRANVAAQTKRGVPYVTLTGLMKQFGGSVTEQPSRIRLDLADTTAYVKADARRVTALTLYSLRREILEYDGVLWISVEDVPVFFQKSFRVEVEDVTGAGERVESLAVTPPEQEPAPSEQATAQPFEQRIQASQAPVRARSTTEITRKPAEPTRVLTVIIDPGHGGSDEGARSAQGLSEKTVTLAVGQRLAAALSGKIDADVVMSREDDLAIGITQRSQLLRNTPGALVISLHAASEPTGRWHGFGVYRHSLSDQEYVLAAGDVAVLLQRELTNSLRARYAETPVKSRTLPLQLMASSGRPGVLIELGFLSHAEEGQRLGVAEYQQGLADSIAEILIPLLSASNAAEGGAGE